MKEAACGMLPRLFLGPAFPVIRELPEWKATGLKFSSLMILMRIQVVSFFITGITFSGVY